MLTSDILSFRSDSFATWCVKTTCAYSLYDMAGVGITVCMTTNYSTTSTIIAGSPLMMVYVVCYQVLQPPPMGGISVEDSPLAGVPDFYAFVRRGNRGDGGCQGTEHAAAR